ncbi:unnamed protein product [Rotaria sp. Silwood1]|nr:unnamed protein product [Rotaria sp. Silwood1]CAF1495685.1 unnamed protein product [Rotaria sp. Silwood1]CAF1508413.1 unnamed protein product [Rotaria sp. Silwood1]CAF3656061.1 unnamed protein product [Rotaria sp. Silwood1]CAF3667106.1 unnamed protein product [Rotaria sp. Silwood1]
MYGISTPALSNHPGRAALISGPPRQSISQNISNNNRLITSSTTTASSPSLSTIEQSSHYLSSHNHSEQPLNSGSGTSTSSRTSISDTNETTQRDSNKSSSSVTAPKSLLEWHEQPVNLSEQPLLPEKVHVQILSPNSDRTTTRFFVDNDLASLIMPNGELKTKDLATKTEAINNQLDDNENK